MFPAMAALLCLGSALLTLCLVVSSTPLLLHDCCCFSWYPLPPAILGNLCAHFMLSLDLERDKLLCYLPASSVHVLVKDYNKSKIVYKNVPLQESLGPEALYYICPFPCCCPISFSVPLAHSGGFIFLFRKLIACSVLHVILFISSQTFLCCYTCMSLFKLSAFST